MSKVLTAKANELFLLMEHMFDKGKTIWIIVSGRSMLPFLRQDLDMVELKRATYSDINVGDIVLILRENGEYVLHRVYKKVVDELYLLGDAQQCIEGPIRKDQIKAVVINIKRENRMISRDSYSLRVLIRLWTLFLPFRSKLLRIYGLLCKMSVNCSKNE